MHLDGVAAAAGRNVARPQMITTATKAVSDTLID
jgi:hypothetical protein